MSDVSDALNEIYAIRTQMQNSLDAFAARQNASIAEIMKIENKLARAVTASHAAPMPAPNPAPVSIQPTALVGQRVVKPGPNRPADTRANRAPSTRQLDFIDHLCDEKFARIEGKVDSMLAASQVIAQLQDLSDVPESQRDESTRVSVLPSAPDPMAAVVTPVKDKLDYNILRMIPDGRYAVANDDETQVVFMRVSTRKSKALSGTEYRVVQYKSSDTWNDLQFYFPTGNVTGRNTVHGSTVADLLTQIMMDKAGCADRYGAKFSECVNCGRELTDDKSRYYRLGSECITKRADVVDYVDNKAGAWYPGAASRD